MPGSGLRFRGSATWSSSYKFTVYLSGDPLVDQRRFSKLLLQGRPCRDTPRLPGEATGTYRKSIAGSLLQPAMPATLLSPDGRAARPTLQVTQIRWFWNFRKAAFGSPGKDAPITQPELVGMDGGRSPREGGQRYRFITDTAVEGRAVRPAANRARWFGSGFRQDSSTSSRRH